MLGEKGWWAGEHRATSGGEGEEGRQRERGNAPNHDNFSSPQLHC